MKLVKKNIFDEDKTCLWVASVAIGRDGHFFFFERNSSSSFRDSFLCKFPWPAYGLGF